MPLDLALRRQAPLRDMLPEQWRKPLLRLALGWAVILLLFAPVFADMFWQYWDSSTYNHILFVPFILAWLVKLRGPELVRMTPRAWWPGLVPLAGALFLWLLGEISGLAAATHLGAVAAMQCVVLALLGPRIFAALLFPLCYAFFLVPVGDELVPTLQMITAELTIALTHWSGIPAVIEGVFIDTPAGLFEVAEACSGVKFLIAMVALGTLAANVCFVSWKRRAVFMLAAVTLPILANGVRAWGTIYIAQSQGIEFAAGFDHIFYGWFFFALVMGLLLAVSWRFFDRSASDRFINAEDYNSRMFAKLERFGGRPSAMLGAVLLLSLGAMAWSAHAKQVAVPIPQVIALPPVEGWEQADYVPAIWWEPRATGADHRLIGTYRNSEGAEIDVFFALYANQQDGREASAYGEGALRPDTDWRWHSPGPQLGPGKSEWLRAPGAMRLAVTTYRHRDFLGGSVARLKLSNMRDSLLFDPYPTMMLILSARDGQGVSAEDAIGQFLASTAPLEEWMDRLAQNP